MKVCLVFLTLFLSYTSALECFSCGSQHSGAECKENQKSLTCHSDQDRCFAAKMELPAFNFKVFGKGCRPESECNSRAPKECEMPGAICEAKCCQTDSCNM